FIYWAETGFVAVEGTRATRCSSIHTRRQAVQIRSAKTCLVHSGRTGQRVVLVLPVDRHVERRKLADARIVQNDENHVLWVVPVRRVRVDRILVSAAAIVVSLGPCRWSCSAEKATSCEEPR